MCVGDDDRYLSPSIAMLEVEFRQNKMDKADVENSV